MSKQQTAVEWLADSIDKEMPYREILILIEEAKAMYEKEMIEFADNYGLAKCVYDYERAEQYYNDTFKK